MRESRKLYTVDSDCVIPISGGLRGPLSTPTVMPLDVVVTLVRKGNTVYQHNPVNLTEKVLLTVENVANPVFGTTMAETVTKRALNKSIQDLGKPMMADVTRKEETVTYEKKFDKNNGNKKNNNNNSSNTQKSEDTATDVTVPDTFTKN